VFATLMAPLIAFTVYWGWSVNKAFQGLSSHTSLSSVFEVQRGEATGEVARLRAGYPVTWSQSNLNRRRYAENDETLYVAPEDDRTDYSQPPMANWYYGILNTGKRRYGHPALTGVLPQPWLPIKKGQTLANHIDREEGVRGSDQAVVLTLRRRQSSPRKSLRVRGDLPPEDESSANPWSETRTDQSPNPQFSQFPTFPSYSHQLTFDPATGVIMLPDDGDWMGDMDSSDSEADSGSSNTLTPREGSSSTPIAGASVNGTGTGYGSITPGGPSKRRATYYHHPERKRRMPGSFTDTRGL